MRTKFGIFVALFSLVGAGAAYAHHSFSTEYDGTKTFEIKGTVSKVEWTNPHARFYVDTKEENGKVVTWNMKVTERYTRPSKNYLIVQITVDDPKVLTRPWTSAPRRWTLGNGEVYEFYCTNNHELDELGKLKEQEPYGK